MAYLVHLLILLCHVWNFVTKSGEISISSAFFLLMLQKGLVVTEICIRLAMENTALD